MGTAPTEIPKAYEPKLVEDKWYAEWLAKGYFTANAASTKPAYCIVMPPPNVTGILTMGHVLGDTIQDILCRRKRMQGYEVLWLPGTDHAGIATQTVVEKTLRKQGVMKHRDDLGREQFIEKVWEWKEKHGGIIIQQLKKLGCSCDFTRERFTMDEAYSRRVLDVFVDLYKKGLIYRGKRMVNWDPAGRTALSDEEVIMTETQGHLWHFKYPLVPELGGTGVPTCDHLVVATTRPETMLGDEAVAVNPSDARYTHLIGRKVLLPLRNKKIPIIADEAVDPKFGTGCVKVTPAHDLADYEMALRHKLPFTVVIAPDGTMTEQAGEDFEGLDRFECREAVIEQLKVQGLLLKVEDYTHNVGYSERTNVPIEPYLSEQWFLKYPQVSRSTEAVEKGEIKFYPERWERTYAHWMGNIRDWCLSRQLWWGHQIPVWYDPIGWGLLRNYPIIQKLPDGKEIQKDDIPRSELHKHIRVQVDEPPDETKFQQFVGQDGKYWHQEPDVLDTWFSSWLWPFATMGWSVGMTQAGTPVPPTLQMFYPTTDLVTGPDIIFFWVARMIMAGYEYMGAKPFGNVYYTGIIRDAQGRKMSKSLGNSPDPLDLIAKYGADGLRVGLMLIAPQGQDILFDEKRCEVGRNFMNKLWNAARFIQMQRAIPKAVHTISVHNDKIRYELNETIKSINKALDEYRLNEAAKILFEFVWKDFCDWYIEATKFLPNQDLLEEVFQAILKLLHPFAPFVTEELWRNMSYGTDTIQFANWPKPKSDDEMSLLRATRERAAEVDRLYELIAAGRKLLTDYGIDSKKGISFAVRLKDDAAYFPMAEIMNFLGAQSIVSPDGLPTGTPSTVTSTATLFLVGAVDPAQERQRLTKQLADIDKQLAATDAKLANESFVSKAAPIAVQRERDRQQQLREQREKIQALLQALH